MPHEGELSVGGVCLFMGYFGEPLSRNPIKDDAPPLYFRTGDFAKRLRSGDLVFLGRKDRTVKVNGQRVALEEVENAIREHPEVREAPVTFANAHGEPSHLQAFFVMKTTPKFEKGHISDVEQQLVEELTASIRNWKIDYAMLSSSTCMPKQPSVECGKAHSFEGHMQIIKEGVGGIMELAPGYLPAVYESIKKAGGLCIADEVQSGFACTGSHLWEFGGHGVVTDIVTLSKALFGVFDGHGGHAAVDFFYQKLGHRYRISKSDS